MSMACGSIQSTIVEILYARTPGHRRGRTQAQSTIVEILYVRTPSRQGQHSAT